MLVTDDIIAEYAEKLASHRNSTQERVEFLSRVFLLSETVEIRFFHLRHYPADLDDVIFPFVCNKRGSNPFSQL